MKRLGILISKTLFKVTAAPITKQFIFDIGLILIEDGTIIEQYFLNIHKFTFLLYKNSIANVYLTQFGGTSGRTKSYCHKIKNK